MDKPLDELYFTWLYSQVGVVDSKDPSASYWKLLKLFYTKEFVWFVPNDDNRANDGRDLRMEFLNQEHISRREVDREDPHWLRLSCDMLELFIGMSRRLAFEGDGHPRDWFWVMIENLNLHHHRDGKRWTKAGVDQILDRVIWRTYDFDGNGGIFPLRYPTRDQRKVELGYQMSLYLLELE